MEDKIPLTPRQREVYNYISQYIGIYKYAPTLSEIAKSFNFKTTSSVQYFIEQLALKGWIKHFPKYNRGIALVSDEKKTSETTNE